MASLHLAIRDFFLRVNLKLGQIFRENFYDEFRSLFDLFWSASGLADIRLHISFLAHLQFFDIRALTELCVV